MAIGIWLFLIGIVLIIIGIIVYYFTSILTVTWLWLIVGIGLLLIIVGGFLFFFQRGKKKEEKKVILPPPPPPPVQIPIQQPAPQPVQEGGISPEILLLLQQNQAQNQQLQRELAERKDDERFRRLEKQLSEQKAPPEVIIPGKGTYQPVRVNQGPTAREQFVRTAFDPTLIQSGFKYGTEFATNKGVQEGIQNLFETGNALASNPRVQQLVQNALQSGVKGISSASKLI